MNDRAPCVDETCTGAFLFEASRQEEGTNSMMNLIDQTIGFFDP